MATRTTVFSRGFVILVGKVGLCRPNVGWFRVDPFAPKIVQSIDLTLHKFSLS